MRPIDSDASGRGKRGRPDRDVGRDRVLVGVFGAAHGIRGEIRVKSYTQEPLAIARYGLLATEDPARTFTIVDARLLKDDLLAVRVAGVDDRTAAESLTNLPLYVARAQLPTAEEDEFYHADLIGLTAQTVTGRQIGTVVSVQNFGAGDLVEIAPARGETLLIPFAKTFVPTVDLQAGRLVVADAALEDAADGDA